MTECIISSSVLILVIIIIRFLFRGKISRRIQYAMWGLVLLRLLMPFSLFESPLSIMNAVEIEESPVITYIVADSSQLPDLAVSEPGPNGTEADYEAAKAEYEKEMEEARAKVGTPLTVADVLSIVWLIGSIAVGIWFATSNFIFYSKLKKSRAAYTAKDCRLPVYVTEQIASPCLFGVFHPAVYLTPKAAENEKSTDFVITHELCHYRHGDHIWSVLRTACLAAYWWNPLVWVAAVLSRSDSELACDEAVIRQTGEENRLAYGHTLIDMIAVKKAPAGIFYAATTMVSGKRGIKDRLNMIIKNPKTFIPALIAAVILVAVSIGTTFTGAKNTPWRLTAELSVGSITSVSAWTGKNTRELDNAEITELVQLLNELDQSDFTENTELAGITPECGLRINYDGITLSINQADGPHGSLEISGESETGEGLFSNAQWWIDNIALLDFIRSTTTEENGYLSEETYPGNHYTVLFSLSDGTNATLLLSQPIRQDSTGIWCVERWFDSYGNKYLVTPEEDGLAADYYERLQEECGNGHRPGLLDPANVAMEYITGVLGQNAALDDLIITETASYPLRVIGTQTVDRTDLDSCMSDTILTENASDYSNEDFAAEAHTILKTVEDGDTATVYAMALYLEFGYSGGAFSETGGCHMPVAITFEKNDKGEYELTEYWTPHDGSYYAPSIREKFPQDVSEDAISTQKYIRAHMQSCYAQAIEYGQVDTSARLAALLEAICSSPATSSNPGDYIDEHPIEYRKMLYYGDYTLRYVFSEFLKGGQTDLRGHVMLAAMRELLGGEDIELEADTGQEWFDEWKSLSAQALEESSMVDMKENYPKTAIMLQMLGEAER